jgi:hypothetical protein
MKESLNDIASKTISIFKNEVIKLPYFDGINYLNNVKSLQIRMTEDDAVHSAIYSVFSNTILFPPKKVDSKLLLHELIHMASANRTVINQMSYKMGYEIATPDAKRVTALNEGLTQLIVCNVTDGHDEMNDIYPFETRIAKMLCYIFGEKEIYKDFFKADPESFIRNIMGKTGDNSIATVIVKMDELLATMKAKETGYFNDKCAEILFDIQKVLVDMYFKMKNTNKLDYGKFSTMLITKDCDNTFLSTAVNGNDMGIDQYFRDRVRQK